MGIDLLPIAPKANALMSSKFDTDHRITADFHVANFHVAIVAQAIPRHPRVSS
jgi:hypothetical protein